MRNESTRPGWEGSAHRWRRGCSYCASKGCFVGSDAAWSRTQTKRTTLPPGSVRESRYCAGALYFSAHHSVARCTASRYSASLFAKKATAVPGLGSAAPAFAATTADPARVATMRTSVRITGKETPPAHPGFPSTTEQLYKQLNIFANLEPACCDGAGVFEIWKAKLDRWRVRKEVTPEIAARAERLIDALGKNRGVVVTSVTWEVPMPLVLDRRCAGALGIWIGAVASIDRRITGFAAACGKSKAEQCENDKRAYWDHRGSLARARPRCLGVSHQRCRMRGRRPLIRRPTWPRPLLPSASQDPCRDALPAFLPAQRIRHAF